MKAAFLMIVLTGFLLSGCTMKDYDEVISTLDKRVQFTETKIDSLESRMNILEEKQNIIEKTVAENKKVQKPLAKREITADSITTKDMQLALRNASFYKGNIDGVSGPAMTSAIMEFQKANGLKPDGVAGSRTKGELIKYISEEAY